MIFKRKVNIQDVFERAEAEIIKGAVKWEFAEVVDGDMFYDKFGNYYYISMSGGDSTEVRSVLNGEAHNENIEVMPKWAIFEHFKDDKIMRWCDAPTTPERLFEYWNAEENRWFLVTEIAVNAYNVYCEDMFGEPVYLTHETVIKVR